MAMTMMVVMMGIIGLGIIGAGLVALHHLLKKKEKQVTMEQIQTKILPELESMTYRMLDKSMDVVFDRTIEMTKKMTEETMKQYDL